MIKKLAAKDITEIGKNIEAHPEIEAVILKVKTWEGTVVHYQTSRNDRIKRIENYYKAKGMKYEDSDGDS